MPCYCGESLHSGLPLMRPVLPGVQRASPGLSDLAREGLHLPLTLWLGYAHVHSSFLLSYGQCGFWSLTTEEQTNTLKQLAPDCNTLVQIKSDL